MRAFASFLVVLIFVGAVGYAGLIYLRENADKFKPGSIPDKLGREMRPPEPPAPVARGPLDYHTLQAQGGEPKAQAVQAGLANERWAYLAALTPVQKSEGIDLAEGQAVRTLNYDFAYRFGPKNLPEQYLEFGLGAKWDELHFGLGFADTEPSDPTNSHSIELTVLVDGKPAFGPQRVSPVDKPVFTRLDVKNANRVVFSIKRIGQSNTFSPLLLDPFVRLADPPAEDAAQSKPGH
jgi:hypothetical protein